MGAALRTDRADRSAARPRGDLEVVGIDADDGVGSVGQQGRRQAARGAEHYRLPGGQPMAGAGDNGRGRDADRRLAAGGLSCAGVGGRPHEARAIVEFGEQRRRGDTLGGGGDGDAAPDPERGGCRDRGRSLARQAEPEVVGHERSGIEGDPGRRGCGIGDRERKRPFDRPELRVPTRREPCSRRPERFGERVEHPLDRVEIVLRSREPIVEPRSPAAAE